MRKYLKPVLRRVACMVHMGSGNVLAKERAFGRVRRMEHNRVHRGDLYVALRSFYDWRHQDRQVTEPVSRHLIKHRLATRPVLVEAEVPDAGL